MIVVNIELMLSLSQIATWEESSPAACQTILASSFCDSPIMCPLCDGHHSGALLVVIHQSGALLVFYSAF
ncbi:hypothetical protein HanRHA438_Chr03g0116471 [Helianthus annuus]|nr:hypothetical protein HanRHA438_Chr03g0116471 [Helianthus annuus]